MLTTRLTRELGLKVPIVGAPMTPAAGGKLAAAISRAGALGMVGVTSQQKAEQLEADVAEYRALAGELPLGIGLMTWAVDARPELLEAAMKARPALVALSFGDPARYVPRLKAAGIRVASQVQDRASAVAADAAGVDLVVAQGTEAGGHTGGVGTLPLLQIVLSSVKAPVVAAGGIATGRGLAAVLAAGAEGAWIGTPFLVAEEARNSEKLRRRVLDANETDTVHTRVFDVVQRIPWPARFPGRALKNDFTSRWVGHEDELAKDEAATASFQKAKQEEEYGTALLYAGQSVGLIEKERPASEIVKQIIAEAEIALREARRVLVEDG